MGQSNVPADAKNLPQFKGPGLNMDGQVKVSKLSKPIVLRDLAFLEKLLVAQEAAGLRDAATVQSEFGKTGAKDILDKTGLGVPQTGRRIGGVSGQTDAQQGGWGGFDDPLAGHRNSRPRSTVVGAPGMPGRGDLTSQDGGSDWHDSNTQSHDSRGSGYVWVERQTERSSADGNQTWGSTLYSDRSGNFWRSDYHVERSSDGGVTTKETVFDSHNEPIKTTLTVSAPDGTTTEATTNHTTGETTVVQPVDKTEPAPKTSQPTDDPYAHGDRVAPRGWYNPITGQAQNPGTATNNNQVNPGRDTDQASPAPLSPLRLDPKILVVNPSPVEGQTTTNTTPRDVRTGNPTVVDPPRPQ